MDSRANEAAKRRMRQAAQQILEIEWQGEQERSQIARVKKEASRWIDQRKQDILTQVDEDTREAVSADEEAAEKRLALVRQLTDAAQRGDLAEMTRIRQLMDACEP